jgi:mRNA-degrading endonuclease RelE of RelBE toxin-antitoxin system
MTWTVHIHDAAAKQLEAIPPDRRKRILDDLTTLETDPFQGLVKPLKGNVHRGKYRKVSGRYRIIFKPLRDTHRGSAGGPSAFGEDVPITSRDHENESQR